MPTPHKPYEFAKIKCPRCGQVIIETEASSVLGIVRVKCTRCSRLTRKKLHRDMLIVIHFGVEVQLETYYTEIEISGSALDAQLHERAERRPGS